jgi:translation initiation factor IF-3
VPEVRLISEEGEQLGLVPVEDAMKRAQEAELDLVEISPTATPPVCKLMDFGKYKYQIQKKEHDQKRKTHGAEIKGIRIKSFLIDPHDVQIKRKQTREFLEAGHRVVLTLMFRARENQHADLGAVLLKEQFAQALADIAKVDGAPQKDGRKMVMSLSPLPNLKQILAQRARAEKKAAASNPSPTLVVGAESAADAMPAAPEAPEETEPEAPVEPAPETPAEPS